MATPKQNPEIQLGFGTRPQGNAVALFGSNIFVIGPDDNSEMQQSLYTTATGLTAAGLGNKKAWSSFLLGLPQAFLPQSKGSCALAIQSADIPALYLFWSQPNAGVMATSVTDVTQPPPGSSTPPTVNWAAGLVLGDENNVAMPLPDGACVSAVSLGSQAFLVACLVELPLEAGKVTELLSIGLYYVADQLPKTTATTKAGTFGTWPARAMMTLSADNIGVMLPPVAGRSGHSLGKLISIAVTPQVSATSADGNNPLLLNLLMFLTITMANDKGSDTAPFQVALTCPLDDTGSPEAGAVSLAWSSTPSTKSPLTVLPDPAGRIIACGSSVVGGPSDQQKALLVDVFATYGPLAKAGQSTLPAASADTSTPASMMFIVDTANASPPSQSPNADGSGEMTTTSYPLLQLLFYGATTVAQVQPFGTVEVISNYANMALNTPENEPAVMITGIIEGPIPVPNANIIGWQFESTSNDCGTIVYGVAQTTGDQVQQSWNVGASITSEGKIGFWAGGESLGDGGSAGLAWDASVSGGYAKTWSTSTSSTITLPLQQPAVVSVVKQTGDKGPVTQNIGQGITPYGSIFAAPSWISITNLRFLDAQGNVISDGTQDPATSAPQAPIFAATAASIGQSDGKQYVPFLVTPGDLMTYTIDGAGGINATMAALTDNAITKYFDSVIWPAAFDFGAAAGGPSQKYLEFSWSIGPVTAAGFNAVASSLHSNSWNIAASLALGFYWDAKVGVPLIGGEQSQGNLMIGGTGGYSSTTTTTQNGQWGISLQPSGGSPPWGPPSWGTVPDDQMQAINPQWENSVIAHYRFALFFLPDPQPGDSSGLSSGYWVQELIKYGNQNAATANPNAPLPTNLDPGSGCWKIVYVVLEIQTYADMNNGTYTYQTSDPRFT